MQVCKTLCYTTLNTMQDALEFASFSHPSLSARVLPPLCIFYRFFMPSRTFPALELHSRTLYTRVEPTTHLPRSSMAL